MVRACLLLLATLVAASGLDAQSRRGPRTTSEPPPAARFPTASLRVQPTLDTHVSWRSNFLLRDRAFAHLAPIQSDWIVTLRPGLRASLGDEDSRLAASASIGADIVRLDRFTRFDDTSPFADLHLRFDNAITRLTLSAAHEQSSLPSQEHRTTGAEARRAVNTAALDVRHDTTADSDLRLRLAYWSVNYDGASGGALTRQRVASIDLEWRHRPSERLQLGPGVRPRRRELGRTPGVDDLTAYLSASWEASPSLQLTTRAGLGRIARTAGGDARTFGYFSLDGAFEARPTLHLTLAGSSDLHADVLGQLTRRDTAALGARWSPTETRTTDLRLGWSHLAPLYARLRQEQAHLTLAQHLVLGERTVLTASVQLLHNSANTPGWNYRAINLALGASTRW